MITLDNKNVGVLPQGPVSVNLLLLIIILLHLIGYASYDAGKYSPRMLKFNDVEEVIEEHFFTVP